MSSNSAITIVDTMKQVVPAIRRLHDRGAGNIDFWCFFFSLFWATTPIYWLLGFLGGSRLSRERYEKAVIKTSTPHLLFLVSIFAFGLASEFNFPITNGMFVFHLTSDFFLVRLLSWWLMVVVVYYQALTSRVLIIKMVG